MRTLIRPSACVTLRIPRDGPCIVNVRLDPFARARRTSPFPVRGTRACSSRIGAAASSPVVSTDRRGIVRLSGNAHRHGRSRAMPVVRMPSRTPRLQRCASFDPGAVSRVATPATWR
ncbi:hypothetical protein [Burkholderia cepacia]|uniref:hypothetical protein n=1 Tax=Burkholderia cepacia TaxID=292 RepID=UPI000A9D7B8C|nr:hypothetical protein [Burkholderia cepacia]